MTRMLLENGAGLLLENGSFLELESNPATNTDAVCAIDLAMAKLRVKYVGTLGTAATYQDYMRAWAATNSWTGSIDNKKTIMKAALALLSVTVPTGAAIHDIEYLYWFNVTL